MIDHDLSIEYENIEKHINNRNFSKEKDKLQFTNPDINSKGNNSYSKRVVYNDKLLHKPSINTGQNNDKKLINIINNDDFWEDFIFNSPPTFFQQSPKAALPRTKSAYFKNNTSNDAQDYTEYKDFKDNRENSTLNSNTYGSKKNLNNNRITSNNNNNDLQTTVKNTSPLLRVNSVKNISKSNKSNKISNIESTSNKKSESNNDEYATCK